MEKYDVYNQSGKKVGEIERHESDGGGGCGCGPVLLAIGAVALSFYSYSAFITGRDSLGSGVWLIVLVFGTILVHGIYLCCRREELSGGFFGAFLEASVNMVVSGTASVIIVAVIGLVFDFSMENLGVVLLLTPLAAALASLAPAAIMGLVVAVVRKVR